jgi:hypothetical protein
MMAEEKAFMLVEVLVSVVIVSVSILLINHAFSSAIRALSVSNSYRQAVFFMENRIFDINFDMHLGKLANSSDEKVSPHGKFLWEQTILPLEKQDLDYEYSKDDFSIKRLLCSLAWHEAGYSRSIDLLTYVSIGREQNRQ